VAGRPTYADKSWGRVESDLDNARPKRLSRSRGKYMFEVVPGHIVYVGLHACQITPPYVRRGDEET